MVTRAEAKKLLQDNPNNQNPCTASTANIIYGHKPTCTSPQIWYCPHTPDANFDSIRNKPACERQEPINCASLSENSCKSQSSTCTRKPGSSSTTTGYKCIRQDGQPATAADCDSTWAKPSCGMSNTSCSGNIPEGAISHNPEESQLVATNLEWEYSAIDTNRKCEFKCKEGKIWNNITKNCTNNTA